MKAYHLIIATAILLIHNSLKLNATPPDWEPPTNLQFNMQIVARLTAIDGTFSEVETDLVAAFVGDECRGLASPIADVDGLVFLTVGSNLTSGETITFKAWYSVTGQIADLNETFAFTDQGEVGTFDEPFIFTIQTLYPPSIYSIVSTSTGNGIIEPSGTIELVHGSNQLYTFTPDENNHVFDVKINGTSIGGFISSYEFVNLQQNSTIHVYFATGTGIYTYAANKKLTITTNPVSSMLCLKQLNDAIASYSYSITTMDGRIVLKGASIDSSTCIDVSALNSGLYILVIQHDKGDLESHAFLLNK
jgi:hypothetical protein